MKKYLLILIALGFCISMYSQIRPWYVIQSSGNVSFNGNGLHVGDSIFSSQLKLVEPLDHASAVTLCHPDSGIVRYDLEVHEKFKNSIAQENMSEMLSELIGIKSEYVELKSRGDCECLNPKDCLLPDPKLSEWTILSKPIEFSSDVNGIGNYFVQFDYIGETFNCVLEQKNEKVILGKDVFLVNDSTYYDFKNPAFLGFIPDNKTLESAEVICAIKFKILSEKEIEDYVTMNQRMMAHFTGDRLNQEMMYSLYISFGKPNWCDVENWLK